MVLFPRTVPSGLPVLGDCQISMALLGKQFFRLCLHCPLRLKVKDKNLSFPFCFLWIHNQLCKYFPLIWALPSFAIFQSLSSVFSAPFSVESHFMAHLLDLFIVRVKYYVLLLSTWCDSCCEFTFPSSQENQITWSPTY